MAALRQLTLIIASLWLPLRTALADEYVDFDPATATPEVSAPLFVVIAYSSIWLALLGYAVWIWRRQDRLDRELDELRRRVGAESAS